MKLLATLSIICTTIFCFNTLNAQNYEAEKISRSAVFGELGGAGLIFTFNFDTRFKAQQDGLGMRVGFGGVAIDGSGWFVVPIQVNFLSGNKDRGHYFEGGIGAAVQGGELFYLFSTNGLSVSGNLTMGYRLQPPGGGFSFRAGITPVFGVNQRDQVYFIPYIPHISFGYAF